MTSAREVTIPEGRPSNAVLDAIAEQTDFSKAQLQKAYDNTKALGLPAYAEGNPEGYLFPATYQVTPNMTAADLLKTMVAEFKKRADAMDLEGQAKALDMSPHDIVTIASLVQGEARLSEDMPKVSSVVYNRLAVPQNWSSTPPASTRSTRSVFRHLPGTSTTSTRRTTPMTTRVCHLARSTIQVRRRLKAALNPADTNYLYFVTVNLKTGETKFTDSFEEHEQNVNEYTAYCETSDAC